MPKIKEERFPIVVSENGLHIMVDDILTLCKAIELMKKIQDALFDWKKLTKKEV
jgi:hypothetical protein